ncbi:5-deoxy-glucuronate isomerase [Nocardioides sp. YIM 152315]|uniref:5-deoxy-glucuronate isomerase n=1 Tax=Nocardioides sp. YIM 152315 TaxID=3031760 RepID=UPI0023DA8128|nr:5-deoxy-glucuronate isomerase [Nocardioides sp. YIM 152315]MDF1605471.1 5-deoxy-glucuronate isomerase [Nocardioides sp. YIM 152315]
MSRTPAHVVAEVTPASAQWGFTGLRVVDLDDGDIDELVLDGREALVVPLTGAYDVACDGTDVRLAGRDCPHCERTDVVYLPEGSRARVIARGGGRVAIATSRAARRLPLRHVPAAGTTSELRGAGNCSRRVNALCMPGQLEADTLMVCEVVTPSGNWSSYPPHKHDATTADETELEEIYYYEVAAGPGGAPGLAYQRVYGHADREIDVLTEVRSGEVVLVPHGWHGPTMAAPGHDLYYLNVMAGPGPERAWRVVDDPDHGWLRETWEHTPVDGRLLADTDRCSGHPREGS